jgi:hypothetical protein
MKIECSFILYGIAHFQEIKNNYYPRIMFLFEISIQYLKAPFDFIFQHSRLSDSCFSNSNEMHACDTPLLRLSLHSNIQSRESLYQNYK